MARSCLLCVVAAAVPVPRGFGRSPARAGDCSNPYLPRTRPPGPQKLKKHCEHITNLRLHRRRAGYSTPVRKEPVMTVWAWILIAAIVVVAIPAVIVTVGIVRSRRKTQRLKKDDRHEYER